MKDQPARDNIGNATASLEIVSWRICVSVLMGIYFALMLVGCTWMGTISSEDQSYTGKDSILFQTIRSDIMDIVADVGKSMGYGVSDKEANVLTLSTSGSMIKTAILGKLSYATLKIFSNDNGRVLDFDVFVSGNFPKGSSREVATTLVNDFRVRLLETIARTSEKMQEKAALASIKQKPEAPKIEALSSTPYTVIREETLPGPVPAPEEIKATSTTPFALTSKEDKANKPSSQPVSAKKWVCIKAANVRAVASLKGKIIKVLRKGEEVEFLGKSGDWINVKLASGAIGWVFYNLLKSK